MNGLHILNKTTAEILDEEKDEVSSRKREELSVTAKMSPGEVHPKLVEAAAEKMRDLRHEGISTELLAAHVLAEVLPKYLELIHLGEV